MNIYIKATKKIDLYSIKSYHIPVFGLKGDYPLKYFFRAQGGNIAGFKEKNSGIDVLIVHNRRFQDEIEYKFLFALNDQNIPPSIDDGYLYLGTIDHYGYIHVFGINGDGTIYP